MIIDRAGERTVRGHIDFDLQREQHTTIEVEDNTSLSEGLIVDQEPVTIRLPGSTNTFECFIAGKRFSGFGEHVTRFRPRFQISLGNARDVKAMDAYLINMADYHWRDVLRLENGRDSCWELTALGHDDFTKEVEDPDVIETHRATLTRLDGKTISHKYFDEKLVELCTYLSFAHGQRVGAIRFEGRNSNADILFRCWRQSQISAFSRFGRGWLDFLHGDDLLGPWPEFLNIVANEEWRHTVQKAIYWLCRSDSSKVGVDGGIVLIQTALEQLSWETFVNDRRAIKQKAFENLKAVGQIRLLLSFLSIPVNIPERLALLFEYARREKLDGPEVFTRIRNRIVHPERSPKSKIPYYEAYCLGLEYLNLVLLATFKYRGNYASKLGIRWTGETLPVPWAQTYCS